MEKGKKLIFPIFRQGNNDFLQFFVTIYFQILVSLHHFIEEKIPLKMVQSGSLYL